MKISRALLILVAALLLCGDAFGKDKWLDNFEDAKAQAAKEGKAIVANFTGSDWCPYCVKLDKEVLATDDFKEWAKEKAVLLIVDFPRGKSQKAAVKEQNAKLKSEYQISGFPTVLFLSADGEKLGRSGYTGKPPQEWVKSGDRAIDPYLAKLAEKKVAAEQNIAAAAADKKKAEEAALTAKREKLMSAGYRYWTDKASRKVFAKQHAVVGGVVGLVDENGRKLRIKLSDFSQEDQAFIKAQQTSVQ